VRTDNATPDAAEHVEIAAIADRIWLDDRGCSKNARGGSICINALRQKEANATDVQNFVVPCARWRISAVDDVAPGVTDKLIRRGGLGEAPDFVVFAWMVVVADHQPIILR